MTDIIYVNGLSCGDRTQTAFVEDLQATLGDDCRIHRPDLSKLDRSSTKAAVDGIVAQFEHLHNPIVIGFSLGGLWATFLARQGFTDRVVAISPVVSSNWIQIDPLRLKLFYPSLLLGKPFKFTYEMAREHLMKNVPDGIVREVSLHFVNEPASLIREYGLMGAYTKLSAVDVERLRSEVKGLIITGADDRLARADQQTEFADLLGFIQLILPCGHTPQLGPHKDLIHRQIADFVRTSKAVSPQVVLRKAG